MQWFISVLCLAFLNSFSSDLEARTIWHIQSHKPKDSLLNKNFIKYIVNPVNRDLRGKFQIFLHAQKDQGNLHKNAASFSEVRFGNVEGMFSATMYWGKADPVFAIFGDLIGAWGSSEDFLNWYDDENGERFIAKAYSKYNLEFVGFSLSPHESLSAIIPIRNIADLKGKVIRVPHGSMASDFFDRLGALVRPTAMSKVNMSLKSKFIQVADYSSISVNHTEGIYEVAKHTNYPGFHSLPVLDFVVNQEKWNALPIEYRKVILKHTKIWREANIESLKKEDKKSLPILKKNGVYVYRWNKKEVKKARIVASQVWEKYAGKSSEAKAMIDSIKSWLRKNNQL